MILKKESKKMKKLMVVLMLVVSMVSMATEVYCLKKWIPIKTTYKGEDIESYIAFFSYEEDFKDIITVMGSTTKYMIVKQEEYKNINLKLTEWLKVWKEKKVENLTEKTMIKIESKYDNMRSGNLYSTLKMETDVYFSITDNVPKISFEAIETPSTKNEYIYVEFYGYKIEGEENIKEFMDLFSTENIELKQAEAQEQSNESKKTSSLFQ